ncbi:MAG: helix-hairpin-helix domain-containing protein [Oscillospiraceae bacterium]|nr:helix-hairpin-helix domain-containing protein [Oscillospiraceae bacterium]MBQ9930106.1 helix-hairpin-helix domain-containing protein [Oscillospiraceae bacterium]
MKNRGVWLLLIVMIIFASILIGFFLGRNTGRAEIRISRLPQATSATGATQPPDKVNINTAGVEELQKLPGIGAVLAQRIVDYRSENGPFETVTELTMVSGIGVEKLNQILDYITV